MAASIQYTNTVTSTTAGILLDEKLAAQLLWNAAVQYLADQGEDVSGMPPVDFGEEGDSISVFRQTRDAEPTSEAIFSSADVNDVVISVNDNE